MPHDPILEAFDHLAKHHDEQPIVVAEARRVSCGQIARLSIALANELERRGVAGGRLVALSAANGPAFLAMLLALRRRGAAALLIDPTNRPDDHAETLCRLGASYRLSAPRWAERPDEFHLEATLGTEPSFVDDDVAVVKLTSGSTGSARGIVTPSATLVADDDALARSMGLEARERILASIPMGHSYGLSSVVMPALMRGSTLVVPDPRSPFSALHAVRRFDVTFLPTAPAFLGALVRTSGELTAAPSLRLVISAGALLAPDTAAAFRHRTGIPVHTFYGASECGGICYDRAGDAAERGTVGTPVDGVEVSIDAGGADGIGALVVESPAVARGYLPTVDERLGQHRFRSGDLARWRGDEIELCGRSDDLINVRGRKVNPLEIETILARHVRVREAAVLKLDGHGATERIRAVVVCDPPSPSSAELLQWCRAHLTDYKVPRSLVFVDALPRTARGKLDREALRRLQANE